MCTCKVGSSYNSTKIVRILYLIKNEYKWIFSLFLSCCKYILNLCIFISCANGNNSLMMSCSCKSVESFLINIIDNCICFLCFSDNTLYWSILTAVKNKSLSIVYQSGMPLIQHFFPEMLIHCISYISP